MEQQKTVTYKAGEQIFALGDVGDSAYLIQSGLVRISVGKDEDQRILGLLGDGQLLGEMAVIDSHPRMADAFALEDTTLVRIETHQFLDRIERADPLVRALLMLVIERYRSGLDRAIEHNQHDVQPSISQDDFYSLRVEAALKADMAADRVAVQLQPVVALANEEAKGFEALLRWSSEAFPELATQALVDIAEQTRLINELGYYVFKRACEDFVTNGLHKAHWLSINVSAKQLLQPHFVDHCWDIAKEAGMPFEKILFELTESCIPEAEVILPTLNQIRERGGKIALDDYGNGTSSLIHVCRFTVDFVKLDREIIAEIETSQEALTIVRAVVGAAAALGIEVVAEGVQTEAQRDLLISAGCTYVQGYFYAKPAPASECAAALGIK